jgi:transposase-like protein
MSASLLNTAHFQSEEAAYGHVEALLWPNGPVCPHCGVIGRAYTLKGNATRIGLKKCAACRKQFTVKIGTVFEDSHIPLHKWHQAIHLLCASKLDFGRLGAGSAAAPRAGAALKPAVRVGG